MTSVITCPCCHQAQLNQTDYCGYEEKVWFNCPVCDFGCGGKILADAPALAKAIKEYQDECFKQYKVAKARKRAIKKGRQKS